MVDIPLTMPAEAQGLSVWLLVSMRAPLAEVLHVPVATAIHSFFAFCTLGVEMVVILPQVRRPSAFDEG